jgi:lysine 2,3-aminomutase
MGGDLLQDMERCPLVAEFNALAKREGLLPVRVTPHYRRLVEEEVRALNSTGGPLYKVAFPVPERLTVRAPGEVSDFVNDRQNMPQELSDIVLRKYRDRALLLITDKCVGHCMYCFRQDILSDQHSRETPPFERKVTQAIAYLQSVPEVKEVILSGGDPLSLPFSLLRTAISRIKRETGVADIRIHTRNVVYLPEVFTDQLCALLGDYQVRLLIHVVHPYELDGKAEAAIRALGKHGVRCYAQFPLLRGINDHPAVLNQLLTDLDNLWVRPLSIFIPDPINYSGVFRIPLKRLFAIMDELNQNSPSWVNAVRPVLDTSIGKVRRENIVAWSEDTNTIVFARDGKQIIYHDFPAELDQPGDPEVLLWKDHLANRRSRSHDDVV